MTFCQEIEAICGLRTNLCFQCSKCSSGCPSSEMMDLKPAQIMHNICLDREAEVLNSRAIWLCVGCETCSARCPQHIDPSSVMTAARVLAIQKGVKPKVKEVSIYYRGFIDNMRLNGQIHDASVAGITQLLTGQLVRNLPIAWKLFLKGRVKLPPLPIHGGKFRRIYRRSLKNDNPGGSKT